jgi:hypothetical protein
LKNRSQESGARIQEAHSEKYAESAFSWKGSARWSQCGEGLELDVIAAVFLTIDRKKIGIIK